MTPITISPKGLEHLVLAEGNVLRMYRDVAGYPTIGVGHLLTPQELASGLIRIGVDDVPWQDGISHAQSLALLSQDVEWAERAVTRMVQVPLNQHQFDALVSFVFNVGPTKFRTSTLLKRLNAGAYDEVPDQMARWVFAGGKRVRGLVNRRQSEMWLWGGA